MMVAVGMLGQFWVTFRRYLTRREQGRLAAGVPNRGNGSPTHVARPHSAMLRPNAP